MADERDLYGRAELGRQVREMFENESHPMRIAFERMRKEFIEKLERLDINTPKERVWEIWLEWKMLTIHANKLQDMSKDGAMASAELDRQEKEAARKERGAPPIRV